MNKPQILIVEDDKAVRNLIATTLETREYAYRTAENGAAALLEAVSHQPDVIILDLGLPDMDGVEIIKKVREWSNLPIIVVSARSEDSDKVAALDAGADDYLVKPFAFDELLARLRVMTRKRGGERSNLFTIDDLTLDIRSKRVERGGAELKLSAKEYALLEYLIRNKGVVLSRIQIEENIWGFDYEGSSNIVDVYIRYLRRKIDKDHPVKLIHTIRGSGYVLKLP